MFMLLSGAGASGGASTSGRSAWQAGGSVLRQELAKHAEQKAVDSELVNDKYSRALQEDKRRRAGAASVWRV